MRLVTFILILILPTLVGCPAQRRPPDRSIGAKPLVFQLQEQDDSLQNQRIRTLLDFEHDNDLVFTTSPDRMQIVAKPHTGHSALQIESSQIYFRISSVLFSTQFPGEWTMLGAYVRPQVNTSILVELLEGDSVIGQQRNTIAADRWSFVGIDLNKLVDPTPAVESLRLRLTIESGLPQASTWVDNVVLIDNRRVLLDTLSTVATGWKISRNGYTTTIDAPGRFKIDALAVATHDKGWALAEYNPMRVILRSAGDVTQWVLYCDGRYLEDGRLTLKGAAADEFIAAHRNPATITVDEATGKVNRHTQGDKDNDGYNESTGAYQINASAARVQLRLTPTQSTCTSPVFEITGLPDGKVTAMVEGRLIDTSTRLSDGRVLMMIPIRIARPMSMTITSLPKT